jgi:hypothetical protein
MYACMYVCGGVNFKLYGCDVLVSLPVYGWMEAYVSRFVCVYVYVWLKSQNKRVFWGVVTVSSGLVVKLLIRKG